MLLKFNLLAFKYPAISPVIQFAANFASAPFFTVVSKKFAIKISSDKTLAS